MTPSSGNVSARLAASLAVIICLILGKLVLAASSPQATAQQPPAVPATSASAPAPQNTPEMTSHETTATFKVNVRLVQLRVVVRDSHGKAIGTLHKEDFRLFDEGKPQVIAKFDLEKTGLREASGQEASLSAAEPGVTSTPPALPARYIAYVFDDVHLEFGDLAHVREAAEKNLATLQATDRAGIFTISGQNNLDFTDDRNKLREALRHITLHPIADRGMNSCPKMTYYLADRIVNWKDSQALAAVMDDVKRCLPPPVDPGAAMAVAKGAAAQGLITGDEETRLALTSLKDVVRRVSATPGQHSIVLVSPGFLTPEQHSEVNDIIERALRANITISAIDARGLYVVMPSGDASEGPVALSPLEAQYQSESASVDANVMAELADGTGGSFFQRSNDFEQGFRIVASMPEYYYVLAFSPQNLKPNGSFHHLKVTLNSAERLSIQARQGYFAPKQAPDRDQEAKQEIQDALYSQEEMHQLPVDLHTQFFKPSETAAKLTVLAHIDVRPLHFRKADGRNNSNLTIVSAVFDNNGSFVMGTEKTLELHLKDDTLAKKLGSGLDVRSSFDVKPGNYLVRLVVRDEEGQIAADNGAVRIP
jgi:VWFA-related protein